QTTEHHAVINFALQLFPRHVRFCPTIRRNNSFVRPRAIINDCPYLLKISLIAATNHELLTSPLHSEYFVSSGTSVGLSNSIRYPSGSVNPTTHKRFPTNGS